MINNMGSLEWEDINKWTEIFIIHIGSMHQKKEVLEKFDLEASKAKTEH